MKTTHLGSAICLSVFGVADLFPERVLASQMQAERNSNNNASALEAPPVMPAELSKLRTGAFINDVVDPYRQHVMKFCMADDIEKVENEHKELLVAYSREPGVKAAFDAR
jgi:hypothetical protein